MDLSFDTFLGVFVEPFLGVLFGNLFLYQNAIKLEVCASPHVSM